MRISKTKWLARWAGRERISGQSLREATERAGQGRSGGYRMLVAYRSGHRAVFLYGFGKGERENIGDDELLTLREIGAAWPAADAERMAHAIEDGILQEVTDDETKPA